MPSGLVKQGKANVRKLHAQGKVALTALFEADGAYHSEGTCIHYTANSTSGCFCRINDSGAAFSSHRRCITMLQRHVYGGYASGLMTRLVSQWIETKRKLVNAIIACHWRRTEFNRCHQRTGRHRAAGFERWH